MKALGKNIVRRWVLLLVGVLGISITEAQDLHFSQFYESPLTLNPALCGQFNGAFYGEINYRTQWSSVMGGGNGFNTMAATMEFHNLLKNWSKGYLSEGLSFYNDRSGDNKMGTTEIAFTTAAGILLNAKSSVAAGLQAAWAQRSMNMATAQWGEQYINGSYDQDAPTGETSIGSSASYTDFSGGLAYNFTSGTLNMTTNNLVRANLGFAAFHINQPNISFYGQSGAGDQLYMRYDVHGYLDFGIKKTKLSIEPGFAYYMQGPSSETDVGATVKYYMIQQTGKYAGTEKGANTFDMGLYYRLNDSFIAVFGLRLKSYTMGISYDLNVSPLHVASSGRGALELSLKYIK